MRTPLRTPHRALSALARSVAATMEALAGDGMDGSARGEVPVAALSRRALERLAEFWPGLA